MLLKKSRSSVKKEQEEQQHRGVLSRKNRRSNVHEEHCQVGTTLRRNVVEH
jgi:hypothetical protein